MIEVFALMRYCVPMTIDWNRYRVELNDLGRSQWTRGLRDPPQGLSPCFVPEDHDLWVIAGGKARMGSPTGWHELTPGICAWLRPGVPYRFEQEPESPLRLHYFHFDLIDMRGRRYPASAPLPPESIEAADLVLTDRVAQRIVDRCFGFASHGDTHPPYAEPDRSIATTQLTGLLMELDDAASTPSATRLPHRQEAKIRQAAIRIAENPAERVPVEELARGAGYSRSHFSRLFARLTGATPERYAILMRLSRAGQLLATTDLPIGEIAARLGYADIFFFSRQFKAFKGVSPRDWRGRHAAVGDPRHATEAGTPASNGSRPGHRGGRRR